MERVIRKRTETPIVREKPEASATASGTSSPEKIGRTSLCYTRTRLLLQYLQLEPATTLSDHCAFLQRQC
jgi:hypothetical protein